MATNDFQTFAGDPAADVLTQAAYIDPGFTARLLGFSTGTALTIQLNKVWRQASLVAHVIGQFTVDEIGQDMLDDGTPGGLAALEAHFRAAVVHVAQGSIGTNFLPLTGGTLTGPLQINANTLGLTASAGAGATFNLARQQGQAAQLVANTGATGTRWQMLLADNAPEQGSNSGSNFVLNRYNDSAVFLDTPLAINRATGVVNFSHPPTVNGGALPYLPIAGGTLSGQLGIGGQGMTFPALGGFWAQHRLGFGWDGSFINGAVDGTNIGQLATVGWTQSLTGNYLPLAGGNLSGQLNIHAPLYVDGLIWGRSNVYFANLADFVNFWDGSRYRYRQWAGNWYDYWDGATGTRGWSQNGAYMTLDHAGNLTTSGSMTAYGSRILSLGAQPSVCAYSSAGVATGFWTDASGMWLGNTDGSGNPSSAHMLIDNNGYVTLYNSGQTNGWWTVAGSINCGGGVNFTGSGSQGSIWGIGNAGAWRILGVYPNFQQLGVNGYGGILSYNTQYHPDGGGAWSCDIAGTTTQAGYAYAPGYPGPSDASLKTNIVPWTAGLAAVLRINPVSFEFTDEAKLGLPGERHIGVTAQDVEGVLADAVVKMPRYLSEQRTEVLAVESATIFYACVNAIKEIAARLGAVEAALKGA